MMRRPIFCASMAISMNSASLKPLQMIGVSLSASATTASSSGLEPASRPNPIRTPEFEDLLDDLPLLIDLDGIHAHVTARVLVLRDRRAECLVDVLDPVLKDVSKPDQRGQMMPRSCRSSTSCFRSIDRVVSFVG